MKIRKITMEMSLFGETEVNALPQKPLIIVLHKCILKGKGSVGAKVGVFSWVFLSFFFFNLYLVESGLYTNLVTSI